MTTATEKYPIRLTVCDTADQAVGVVSELKHARFTPNEITVVCSEEVCDKRLKAFMHETPAGSNVSNALDMAGAGALGLGAAAVLVGVLTTAGTAVMAIGAFTGIALAGTFSAMMVTRGFEKEMADYYDQAITHGKILVGVETTDPTRQAIADEILKRGGPLQMLPKEDHPRD